VEQRLLLADAAMVALLGFLDALDVGLELLLVRPRRAVDVLQLLVAREAVDAHLQVAGAIIDPGVPLGAKAKTAVKASGFYARWLPSLVAGKGQLPGSYREFGRLARHIRFIERSSRKLARTIFYAMSRYQGKLERKQALLARLVDIGAELYAMSATCVRARMLAGEGQTDALELADLFCRNARIRIDRLFNEVFGNADAFNYKVAQRVLDGRHTWLETGILDPEWMRSDAPDSVVPLEPAAEPEEPVYDDERIAGASG
jgi:hypothetical protein